ncbi:MAG: hypothetical protein ACYTA5_01730 [Planctomycetota bacterium]
MTSSTTTETADITANSNESLFCPPVPEKINIPDPPIVQPVCPTISSPLWKRLPWGAIIACSLLAAIHMVMSVWIFPHPVARSKLRYKVMALIAEERPVLIVAGDSRAEQQIVPAVMAQSLGLPVKKIINTATSAGDSSSVLAICQEFAERFESNPIMLISVSLFSVNDGANAPDYLGDEVLWPLSLSDRLQIVPLRQAITSEFLPEIQLYRQINDYFHPPTPSRKIMPTQGFFNQYSNHINLSPSHMNRVIEHGRKYWFSNPRIDGVRWQKLKKDLLSLRNLGIQPVILDTAEHPAFLAEIANTPMGQLNQQFHTQLSNLCQKMNIPLLRYQADVFAGHDVNELFYDILHVNCKGAEILSEIVARDIQRLIDTGRLSIGKNQDFSSVGRGDNNGF